MLCVLEAFNIIETISCLCGGHQALLISYVIVLLCSPFIFYHLIAFSFRHDEQALKLRPLLSGFTFSTAHTDSVYCFRGRSLSIALIYNNKINLWV